jgi:choline dehydrogenase-like flavoprotein
MWEHSEDSCREIFKNAGAEYEGDGEPESPGYSLRETGTCRVGNDPRQFVTNRFGQTHDVPNVFVCDASTFANCTDKTTTLSILTFALRTSEYVVGQFKNGRFTPAAGNPL